jgi:valyl-tRNA synthetase
VSVEVLKVDSNLTNLDNIDVWIIDKLNTTITLVNKAIDHCDFNEAVKKIDHLCEWISVTVI